MKLIHTQIMAILLACWINPSYGFMSVTISTADRGAIYPDGMRVDQYDQRFIIGWSGLSELRSYFVYLLPALEPQTVLVGAEVQLRLNTMLSRDPSEPIEFHDITGITTNTSEYFQDLADGALYGSAAITGPDWTSVPLTSEALNDMMTIMYAGGGMFALGGTLSSLQYLPYETEEIMGWLPAGAGTAGTAGSDLLLTLTTIPEPSSTALFFLGGLGLLSRQFRKFHDETKT